MSTSGMLGGKWGEDAEQRARDLGLRCQQWLPWDEACGFELCADQEKQVTHYGHPATLYLIRRQGKLEAVQLRFRRDDAVWRDVRAGAEKEFGLKKPAAADDGLYQVFKDRSLVRLMKEPPQSMLLTVAGPRFGAFYSDRLLSLGAAGSLNSLSAH